jgi:hypothetical protein
VVIVVDIANCGSDVMLLLVAIHLSFHLFFSYLLVPSHLISHLESFTTAVFLNLSRLALIVMCTHAF